MRNCLQTGQKKLEDELACWSRDFHISDQQHFPEHDNAQDVFLADADSQAQMDMVLYKYQGYETGQVVGSFHAWGPFANTFSTFEIAPEFQQGSIASPKSTVLGIILSSFARVSIKTPTLIDLESCCQRLAPPNQFPKDRVYGFDGFSKVWKTGEG